MKRGRVDTEAQVGPPAQRAELGTGGVDEDPVGQEAGRRPGPWISTAAPARAARVRIRERRDAIRVAGVDRSGRAHRCGELERLPAGAGAEVEDRLAGEGAHGLAEELAPLVLDLEETLPERREGKQVGSRGEHLEAVRGEGGRGDSSATRRSCARVADSGRTGACRSRSTYSARRS